MMVMNTAKSLMVDRTYEETANVHKVIFVSTEKTKARSNITSLSFQVTVGDSAQQ